MYTQCQNLLSEKNGHNWENIVISTDKNLSYFFRNYTLKLGILSYILHLTWKVGNFHLFIISQFTLKTFYSKHSAKLKTSSKSKHDDQASHKHLHFSKVFHENQLEKTRKLQHVMKTSGYNCRAQIHRMSYPTSFEAKVDVLVSFGTDNFLYCKLFSQKLPKRKRREYSCRILIRLPFAHWKLRQV